MRAAIAIIVSAAAGLSACSKSENAGADEARKQAEAEQKAKEARGEAAKKISPPVRGQEKVACGRLIDPAAFQRMMEEPEPLGVAEKSEAEAAASCSLLRGGKRPTEAEQQKLLKEVGRLGVLPGDELCNVSAFCWTIEDPERFKRKCAERKDGDDESMGTYACRQLVQVGADDVYVYRFFDEDTKCILQVRGGPSNVDNESIRKCAIAARDSIGPAQIVPGAVEPPAAAPTDDSAGSASE